MSLLCARSSSVARAGSAGGRRAVVAQASNAASRRALLGMSLLPALLYAPKALALIPDEEDEDLLEKAKANRRARLEQQRSVTREFLSAENLKDKRISSADLTPVQRGVFKLAQSGSQLEAGDLKAAGSTLSEAWVSDFAKAATALSSADTAQSVTSGLSGLQAAVSSGNLAASKKSYVSLVSAVQAWAAESGVASSLQGL